MSISKLNNFEVKLRKDKISKICYKMFDEHNTIGERITIFRKWQKDGCINLAKNYPILYKNGFKVIKKIRKKLL